MMPKLGLERGDEGDAVDDEELRRRDFAEDKRPGMALRARVVIFLFEEKE